MPTLARPDQGAALTRTPVTNWTLHVRGDDAVVPEPARAALVAGLAVGVPATALAALVEAGLAGDVTVDATEDDIAWVAATAWEYRARLVRPAGAVQARLVLEGVDTVGRVVVDGRVVLETADMHLRHVVDLPDGADEWDVRVELDPALPVAADAEARNPLPRADVYELPYNQVRKMACSFGWDWGPVTLTAGLWRPVQLETWSGARLEDVRVSGGWDADAGAHLRVAVSATGDCDAVAVRVRPAIGGESDEVPELARVPLADGRADTDLTVAGVVPWQPVGLGAQPLHDVEVTLLDAEGGVLDSAVRRTGFRDVALRRTTDAGGESFELVVNGTRVWVRGFNWIPPHVLPETVDRAAVRHLVSEAVAAGANLLRVWGGGVLESEDFYDICDELGVLVWQDFPFACAAYPEDEATAALVRAEATQAVVRLGRRPSLVLWCGCNENLWGFEDWDWQEPLAGRPWGAGYYHDLLPTVLAELDGTRPYIPGSPYSPSGAHPNDPATGPTHHWDTWNELDYTAFEVKTSRFASEFGWQAPAGWPALTRALGGPPSGPDDARLSRLQKAYRGMESLDRGIGAHLPEPQDGRQWWHAAQLVQARAVRASIGRFRSLHDHCSGAVWWQLDDCWPALSWSVLDVTGRRKLAWYAMREVLAPRAVLPTAPDPAALTLVNDLPEPWETSVRVAVASSAGAVLHSETRDVVVPALGHLVVDVSHAVDARADLLVVDAGTSRAVRWMRADLELDAVSPAVSLRVEPAGPGVVRLLVRADTLVRDLAVLAETDERLADVVVDDQLRTLLPGEELVVEVRAARVAEVTAEQWCGLLAAGGTLDLSVTLTD